MRIETPAQRRRRALNSAYHSVFGSRDGEMVLRDILEKSGMLQTSFVEGDSHSTSFNEGKRRLALEIIAHLSWSAGELRKLAERMTSERLADAAIQTEEMGE